MCLCRTLAPTLVIRLIYSLFKIITGVALSVSGSYLGIGLRQSIGQHYI